MTPEFRFPRSCDYLDQEKRTGVCHESRLCPHMVEEAVLELREEGYFIEDVTGLDVVEGIEVIYHFNHFERPGRVIVRTFVPHWQAELPSIAAIFDGADWHERETMDMFPIRFTGHPNPLPLLLSEDMKDHPLSKDPLDRHPAKDLCGCKAEKS